LEQYSREEKKVDQHQLQRLEGKWKADDPKSFADVPRQISKGPLHIKIKTRFTRRLCF
jgi:hypothetical protein